MAGAILQQLTTYTIDMSSESHLHGNPIIKVEQLERQANILTEVSNDWNNKAIKKMLTSKRKFTHALRSDNDNN